MSEVTPFQRQLLQPTRDAVSTRAIFLLKGMLFMTRSLGEMRCCAIRPKSLFLFCEKRRVL